MSTLEGGRKERGEGSGAGLVRMELFWLELTVDHFVHCGLCFCAGLCGVFHVLSRLLLTYEVV